MTGFRRKKRSSDSNNNEKNPRFYSRESSRMQQNDAFWLRHNKKNPKYEGTSVRALSKCTRCSIAGKNRVQKTETRAASVHILPPGCSRRPQSPRLHGKFFFIGDSRQGEWFFLLFASLAPQFTRTKRLVFGSRKSKETPRFQLYFFVV